MSLLYLLKDGRCSGMSLPNENHDRLKIGRTNKGVGRFNPYLKAKTIILVAYVDPYYLNEAEKALKDHLSSVYGNSQGSNCQVGQEYFDGNVYEIYKSTNEFFLYYNLSILYDITCDDCINFKESCQNKELTNDIFDYCHTYHQDDSHCLQCLYEFIVNDDDRGCSGCTKNEE